jgi:hypothetical protein
VPSPFRFVDGVDPWERQHGETAEQFDWFAQWRNDGHRRTFTRTAEKFQVTTARVAGAAKRNQWQYRLGAWKAANSQAIHERYSDLAEQALVPFIQATARLAAHAAQADLAKLPADRALVAATGALRLVKEPDVTDLIRISAAGAGAPPRELDVLSLVLDQLAERFPDAHDAVLDALGAAVDDDTGEPVSL